MATNLLQMKLVRPVTRPLLVSRPRLSQRMADGMAGKLLLVSAPAGFGKTTLVAAWLQAGKGPARLAWVSLDEHDDDPARFAAYLTAVLRPIVPHLDEEFAGHTLSEVMAELVNELTAVLPARHGADVLLVLDDYHLITNPVIHNALTFFVEYMPPSMHLCLISRADPPLPLARWRARGQLTELRQQDLRFTAGEAAEFLNQVMGLNLATADVAALNSRAEGWVAGLQMAAVSLQHRPDASQFIDAFTGSNRYILDYLLEEVLQKQPAAVQTFLRQTAVLDRLCAPLYDWLMAGSDSTPAAQEILQYLERANLFIIPLDQDRRWYRYHRLFADLLRQRLRESAAADVVALHQRASRWYEANGFPEAAIDHALQAGEMMRAADLIEQMAEAMMMRSEVSTFKQWLAALPVALVQARPSLCLYAAWILSMEGRSLAEIEVFLRPAAAADAPGELAAVHSMLALIDGQGQRAAALAEAALQQMAPERHFLRGLAAWIMGQALFLSGDNEAGTAALETAVRLSRQVGNLTILTVSLNRLANQAWRSADLHRASRIYQQALAFATDDLERPLPIAGEILVSQARLHYEWDDLDAAYACAVDGVALTERWRELAAMGGYLMQARVWQVRGETAAANEAMARAQAIAHRSEGTDVDDLVVALWHVQLYLLQGNLAAALTWIAERQLTDAVDPAALRRREDVVAGHLRKYEYLTLARIHLAQNRPDRALAVLTPLLADARRQQRLDLVLEILILLALAYHWQGQPAQADRFLEEALTLGEQGGFIRLFVDAGPAVADILRRQQPADERRQAYIQALLASFDQTSPVRVGGPLAGRSVSGELVEPLSERELEVLGLIAAGLSNREIAAKLVLSLPTIKWHTSNIYGKLGVGNRTTAVARARELQILQ